MKFKIYSVKGEKINPLKDIKRKNKVGWEVGGLTIFCKEWDNRIRNILVAELNIKSLVFTSKPKKKKKKSE